MMNKSAKTDIILDSLGSYNPKFEEGFSDRVIEKITNINVEDTGKNDLGLFFKWITLSGVAAVLILLLMVYFTEGSLHSDAIIGLLNYSPDEPLFASLNY